MSKHHNNGNDYIKNLHKDPYHLQIIEAFYHAQFGKTIRDLHEEKSTDQIVPKWGFEPTRGNIASHLAQSLRTTMHEIEARLKSLQEANLVGMYNGTPGHIYYGLEPSGVRLVRERLPMQPS